MIQVQAMAARLACARMTARQLETLQGSVERASCLVGRSEWDRKAEAHAEIFGLLAEVADDPVLAPVLRDAAGWVRELMTAVGRGADWIIVNSRRQLLECLSAGDGEAAALEMEKHLRVLLFMFRLARSGRKA